MKDIFIGFCLMFTCYSCVQFWFWFRDLEKSSQVVLKDYIFGKNSKSKENNNNFNDFWR